MSEPNQPNSKQEEQQQDRQKKVYSNISKEQRQEIIRKILVEQQSIQDVAAQYEMLPSTCKSIVNTYLNEGRIGKKERRVRKLKKITTIYNIVLNPVNPLESTVTSSSHIENIVEASQKSKRVKTDQTQQEMENDQGAQNQKNQQLAYEYISNWIKSYEQQLAQLVQQVSGISQQ